MCGKRLNVRFLNYLGKCKIHFKASVILYGEVKCVEKNEMCGFWKWNFKISDNNFTIEILYREVKCVENEKMYGFRKLNFKMLDNNFTSVK